MYRLTCMVSCEIFILTGKRGSSSTSVGEEIQENNRKTHTARQLFCLAVLSFWSCSFGWFS